MELDNRKVVDVNCWISSSLPNTPITKNDTSFLDKTPIPNTTSPSWRMGISTPLNEGSLTPNQEAIGLLVGFALGSIQMEGDVVQHLPAVKGNQTIGDNLQELPWYTPNPNKTKIDGSAIWSKKAKIVKREPMKHLMKKTKARILAEKNPCTIIFLIQRSI